LQLRAQQLEAVVRQRPDFGPAVAELGTVLMDMGRRTEALQAYRRAVELQPKDFPSQLNFGSLLMDHGMFSSAETHFKKAAALKPEFAGTYNNLGNLHALMGRLDEAISDYRRAVDLDPAHAAIHSNLIFAMNHHPAVTEAQLAEEHARWNTLHARPSPPVAHSNARDPDRVLRVGYISSDFGANQGAFFIAVQLPDGASVSRSRAVVEQIEGLLKPMPQIEGDTNQFQGFAFAFGYIKALIAAVSAEA